MTRSDEELMAAYVGGDASAFDDLFSRYAPQLLRLLRSSSLTPDQAADLVQETFLRVHRARNDWRPGARLRPWVMTIALNLKRELYRRRGRRPEVPLTRADGSSVEPEPVRSDPRVDDLDEALGQLPDAQREAIVLHWIEGFSFSDVGRMVGASTSAVKVRAHRGYRRLRELLDGGDG